MLIQNDLFLISGEFCNNLFENLESSQATRILWRQVKPMVWGYIPFTPNTTAVRRIIAKVKNFTILKHFQE